MGPRRCSGFANEDGVVVECCFNPWEAGKGAQGKFEGKCQWCSPVRTATICAIPRQSKLTAHSLANLHELDIGIYDIAVERVTVHEGGEQLVDRAKDIISERALAGVAVVQPAAVAAGAPHSAEPPPQPPPLADGEGEPAERRRHRLCEGYALGRAMGRQLKSKTDCGRCVFSKDSPGQRAKALDGQCLWCTPARMKEAARNPAKKKNAVTDLKKFEAANPPVYQESAWETPQAPHRTGVQGHHNAEGLLPRRRGRHVRLQHG